MLPSKSHLMNSQRLRFSLGVLAFAVAVALAGCSPGGSEPAERDGVSTVEGDGRPDELAEHGQTTATETQRDAYVYAAVIERLVKDERASGGPHVIFVLDGPVAGAADPTTFIEQPPEPFGHDLKDGVIFLAELAELPPIEFVDSRNAAIVGTASGTKPGRVKQDGALVTLGPVVGSGNRVQVANSIWRNGLSGRWQTFLLAHERQAWKVTGTTGPLAIS
jgi:hypothetical protein